jgi:hypothetical protein
VRRVQIEKAVRDKHVALRTDTVVSADVGLITGLVDLLSMYEPDWLALGLQNICGFMFTPPSRVCASNHNLLSLLKQLARRFWVF